MKRIFSKDADSKLVGAYLPSSDYNFIALVALSRRMSKTDLVKEWFSEWKKDCYDEETYLLTIVRNIQKAWKVEKKEHPRLTLGDFTCRVEEELERKGLNRKQIETIINKTTELCTAQTNQKENTR